MTEKYKADGGGLGTTYGLATDDGFYMQIVYNNGTVGTIHEVEEDGHWGWNWWLSVHEPEQVESFPEDVELERLK